MRLYRAWRLLQTIEIQIYVWMSESLQTKYKTFFGTPRLVLNGFWKNNFSKKQFFFHYPCWPPPPSPGLAKDDNPTDFFGILPLQRWFIFFNLLLILVVILFSTRKLPACDHQPHVSHTAVPWKGTNLERMQQLGKKEELLCDALSMVKPQPHNQPILIRPSLICNVFVLHVNLCIMTTSPLPYFPSFHIYICDKPRKKRWRDRGMVRTCSAFSISTSPSGKCWPGWPPTYSG